ncbi:MAG TPA: hypothetical protein VFA50_15800 [Stellaceae bacterium]|nr:hypothetical protein [Stellaceae bacterium]
MIFRPSSLILALAALGALGACSTRGESTASATTPAPSSAATVTTPSTTTTVTPGTTVITPNSGTSTAIVPATRLTANEIDHIVMGNTISGTTKSGQPYYMKFMQGGEVTYHQGGNYTAAGTWRVSPNGELCTRFGTIANGAEQCYTLYHNANVTNGYVYERPDGQPVGQFVVTPGA